MIEIDGSVGEGGGQILRTSLALAMCAGRSFTLTNIRARRPKPGLMRQHLTCVLAAAEVCGAEVEGAALGSAMLRFVPGPVRAGDYRFTVGTAGSCTLVLQTVWPALLLADAPSRLHLSGGTHNPMAPPFHFLQRAYAPLMRRLGAPVSLTLNRLGFYPAGGGEIEAEILPAAGALQPFDLLERGMPREAFAECLSPALHRSVAQRELAVLAQGLGWQGDQLRVPPLRQSEGPGNALMATLGHEAVTEVFTQFGEKNLPADRVAQALVQEVQGYQQARGALGPHLADQWALPLALAVWLRQSGAAYSCTELTEHSTTNFQMVERFLPVRFEVSGAAGHWRVALLPRAG